MCFRVASSVEVGVDASSDFPQDSGQWSEEKTSLLAKLELLERTKNEEMQNVKTSLIAEQQVRTSHVFILKFFWISSLTLNSYHFHSLKCLFNIVFTLRRTSTLF